MNIGVITISSIIMNITDIFCLHRITNTKINLRSKRLYLSYLIMVILITLNYFFSSNVYKVLITFIIMLLVSKLLFNYDLKSSILSAIILFSLTLISEFIFAIIVVLLNNIDNKTFAEIYQGKIFSNLIISMIMWIIATNKILYKIYLKMLNVLNEISFNKIAILFSFIVLCSSFLFYLSYYNTNKYLTLIVNFVITTIYFIIVIMIIKKESSYNKVYAKYIMTLKDLEEYESIINEYRVINHENFNQLSTIKGMVKSKKVQAYIDEILNNKNTKNEFILKQALLIPTGGLRGLIYSKLIIMKNKNIKYYLNIDKKINNKVMKNISTKTMFNICQIIGVYLDNAIEAVEDLNKKEIMINIYKASGIIIEIINNINGLFDVAKIDKLGYTTKANNKGYGLTLVNNILKEDNNLSNEREINKKLFKQKLIINK